MREPEFLPPEEYRCVICGHMVDTPAHELGCKAGRHEREPQALGQMNNRERMKAFDRWCKYHGLPHPARADEGLLRDLEIRGAFEDPKKVTPRGARTTYK